MHDGRFMRYHKAGGRTLAMLTAPEVPKRADGAIALCEWCQRIMWMNGGYLDMLAGRLERLAKSVRFLQSHVEPRLAKLLVGGQVSFVAHQRLEIVRRAKQIADEGEWTIRLQYFGSERLTITRLK
jgi:hypothetical protein